MCALGEGEEGGEGGREQRASQRLRYPSAELPERGRGTRRQAVLALPAPAPPLGGALPAGI